MKVVECVKKRIKTLVGAFAIFSVLGLLTGCWLINIDTPYYTQTTSYYCGAASAQMVLNSDNLGIYVTPQSDIYNYIHSHNICSGWASDPEGLKDALNNYAAGAAWFTWFAPSDQDVGNNKLAYTLDHYEVPPVALVYGSAHWIVVRGVFTSDQPTAVDPYEIYGFYVNDPWYGTTSLGGNRYIDARTWNDDVFTGGSWCGAPGSPRFISVVDPDPPTKAVPVYPIKLERRPFIFKPAEIREMAAQFLEKMLASKTIAEHFNPETIKQLSVARIGEPKLTRRVDRKMDGYYIVPLMAADSDEKSAVQGAMLFDAYSGEFKEISAVEKAVSYAIVDNKDYAFDLFKRAYDRKRNRVESITDFQRVWAPSDQSRSPFYPLWEARGTLRGKTGPEVLAYMDQSGKLFKTVTLLKEAKLKGGG